MNSSKTDLIQELLQGQVQWWAALQQLELQLGLQLVKSDWRGCSWDRAGCRAS